MPDPQIENAPLSAQDVLASIQGLMKRIEVGSQTSAATVTPVAPLTVANKADQGDEPERLNKDVFVDPLRKGFETLALINKGWGRLTSNKALDDPYSFLHEKKEGTTDQYKISNGQLDAMAQALLHAGSAASKDARGTPLHIAYPKHADHILMNFESALGQGKFDAATQKTLDTSLSGGIGGGALIRTDIEPFLYEAYVRRFPWLDAIRMIPSNGLVHTYDVRSSPGSASNLGELGDLTTVESTSTIERKANANIAVTATKRGISLKLQFAVIQSGMNYPVTGSDNLEVVGAIISIGKKVQYNSLQGNFSTGSKTLDDEEGLTDTNGTDGYRTLLKAAGTSSTKTNGDKYRDVFNKAMASIMNSGGSTDDLVIVMSTGVKQGFAAELQDFLRIINNAPPGFPADLAANGFIGINDMLSKIIIVPAGAQSEGLGYYTGAGSVVFEDVYLTDLMGSALAYLGSPTPTTLELPVGYNNTLSSVYIPFQMAGLVMQVPTFHRKVRVPRVIL